jgi:predicted flap endonuclease-1-like 5' DNA nuclease
MSGFLCWVWPYLMGGLVGWLAAGWLARRALARQPTTVERVVERVVDNPSHLSQIATLSASAALVPQLRERIGVLESAPPRIVEKVVEKPVERIVEKVVEKVVEKPVERIVERAVVDTAGLEARDREIAELRARLRRWTEGPTIDLAAARAAGFSLERDDALEIIEGIGPKIAELLRAAGVTRFVQLAQMTPAQIQPILDAAGPNFRLAVPDTWPEQAVLAAQNHWRALKSLQDALIAGQRG